MTAPTLPPLEQARQNVAARYRHNYHINAILSGDWDAGSLVRDELAKIEGAENEKA